MSTHNIHFRDKIGKFPKISLKICFLELSKNFLGTQKRFGIAMVNESSVFESLKFYCIWTCRLALVLYNTGLIHINMFTDSLQSLNLVYDLPRFCSPFLIFQWAMNSISTKLPFQSYKVLLYVHMLCMTKRNCEMNMFELILKLSLACVIQGFR